MEGKEKKLLIINGSPRKGGDTEALLRELKKSLHCEVRELSAFYGKISPCLDCRSCSKNPGCVIEDDMREIYSDCYDSILLAAPVYFGTLPGPVLNIISRLQPLFAAKAFPGDPVTLRRKRAGLIITAGGMGNEEGALKLSKTLFKFLNAELSSENIVSSLKTDTLPAKEDRAALALIPGLAARLSWEA